jgi:hypothetical protein
MKQKEPHYVDLMEAHLKDFSTRNLDVGSYFKEYYVTPGIFDSHYAPRGNHFTAFAVKNKVVEMLNPKPIHYRRTGTPDPRHVCISLN